MKRKKILVMEDAPNIRFSIELCLKRAEYDVEAVEDGLQGLERAFASPPDLILLDILMPNMNGYLVCEALRNDDRTAEIPIIFVSAKAQKEDKERAWEAGATDYIIKPFYPNDLLEIIKKNIGTNQEDEEE